MTSLRYLRKKFRLLLLILLSVFSPVLLANTSTEKFLTISDIHFSPYAQCKKLSIHACPLIQKLKQSDAKAWGNIFAEDKDQTIASAYHETNYALFKSALTQINLVNQTENPRFIFLLGDSLAHHYRAQYVLYSHDRTKAGFEQFAAKTLMYLSMELRAAIPEKDIYPAVGNNDSYSGNYKVDPNGNFLKDTSKTWSMLISDKKNKASFLQSFSLGGYYAVDVPHHAHQRIIVLNTVLFSSLYQTTKTKKAAKAQLAWLHQELIQAQQQHQQVLLAFHIPLGVDVHNTIKGFFKSIKKFWAEEYDVALREELQQFPHLVTAILAGHIHRDNFPVFVFNQLEKIPLSFTPSISPIYGNDPGFKVYSYDVKTFQLHHFNTYFYSLETKKAWQKE